MSLVLFALAVIGLTNIILDSSLFAPLRRGAKSVLSDRLYEIFECHQCMGTWVGMILGAIILSHPWYFLVYGFSGSAIASTYHRLFVLGEEYILSQTQLNINVEDDG